MGYDIREMMKLLGEKSEQYVAERKRSDALAALLRDERYIQMKADYNRGHLSHAGALDKRERGLGL